MVAELASPAFSLGFLTAFFRVGFSDVEPTPLDWLTVMLFESLRSCMSSISGLDLGGDDKSELLLLEPICGETPRT